MKVGLDAHGPRDPGHLRRGADVLPIHDQRSVGLPDRGGHPHPRPQPGADSVPRQGDVTRLQARADQVHQKLALHASSRPSSVPVSHPNPLPGPFPTSNTHFGPTSDHSQADSAPFRPRLGPHSRPIPHKVAKSGVDRHA